MIAACGGGSPTVASDSAVTDSAVTDSAVTDSGSSASGSGGAPPPTTTAPAVARSPLAASIVAAGSILYDARDHVRGVPPASVTVGAIGVRDSPIVGVGVDENGAFAVPGVSQVGWYEFGPRPGDPGSSVLAGHIAFGGVDGVFRRLASTKVGGDVVVRFVDGSSVAFVVTRIERIDKDELPAELFASSGPAQLVLISCGGAFNRDRQSYEDNIVVIARPTNWSTSR